MKGIGRTLADNNSKHGIAIAEMRGCCHLTSCAFSRAIYSSLLIFPAYGKCSCPHAHAIHLFARGLCLFRRIRQFRRKAMLVIIINSLIAHGNQPKDRDAEDYVDLNDDLRSTMYFC